MKNSRYIVYGIVFSIILIKSEAVSWYRIYEMFQFDSFHMYGLLMSGILTAMVGIKLLGIETKAKKPQYIANILGGLSFGIGWGITGACTGPIFSLVGMEFGPIVMVLIGAMGGTIMYAWLKPYLPHDLHLYGNSVSGFFQWSSLTGKTK